MKKEKLLIPVFMGMSYRNFFQSSIINDLKSKYTVKLVVYKNSRIAELVANEDIDSFTFEKTKLIQFLEKLFFFLEKVQYYSFYQKHHTKTIAKYIRRDKESLKKFWILYFLAYVIGFFYDRFSFFSSHYQYLIPADLKRELSLADKVLLLSTDNLADKAILKFCQNKNIFTSVIVHSWDNLPARGFLATRPDKLLVWNEVMKEEAKKLHGINPDKLKIIGVPQFHFYKQLEDKVTRKDFLDFYKFDRDKKVITYTCSAVRVFPDEDLFLEKLIDYIKEIGAVLVIRLHPGERREKFKTRFSGIGDVLIDEPTGSFAAAIVNNVTAGNAGIYKFISLMKYSDVVINLASTITLDAVIYNTPVICPAFNLDDSLKGEWNNASDWYQSSHYKNILESRAITNPRSFAELKDDIKNFLDDKSYLSKERKKLAQDFCKINLNAAEMIRRYV